MNCHVSSKRTPQKSLQRWKRMGELGAEVYDETKNRFVRVRTQAQGEAFFRGIAHHFPLNTPIPTNDPCHRWLVWLVEGHHFYDEMCPLGVDYFIIQRNCDIGYLGKDLGFSVIPTGANGVPREFSYKQALQGVEKRHARQVYIAMRHAIEDQVSAWSAQHYREGLHCPVTGELLVSGNIRIDHAEPTFVHLVDHFVGGLDMDKENFPIEDVLVGSTHKLLPRRDYLEAWCAYHQRFARLQFVSKRGHLLLDNERRSPFYGITS